MWDLCRKCIKSKDLWTAKSTANWRWTWRSTSVQRYDVTHVTLLPLNHNALLAFELWKFRTVTSRVTWKRLIVTQVYQLAFPDEILTRFERYAITFP